MLTILAAGCGRGTTVTKSTPTGSPSAITASPAASPGCEPSGTQLEIAAKTQGDHPAFDKDCLAAPSETRFTIRFNNEEASAHNIEIFDLPAGQGNQLFSGEVFVGPKIATYTVKPLAEGTYYFRCAIHPNLMHGTLMVAPLQ
ncbi:MAG TPA: cupredoxin domain-containing protein [Gemmatimonadales bacterium]